MLPGRGVWALMLPLLMIRPPCGTWWRMIRNASRAQKNDPLRFAPTTAIHLSIDSSSGVTAGVPDPALLNNRSSRPHARSTSPNAAATAPASATSAANTR